MTQRLLTALLLGALAVPAQAAQEGAGMSPFAGNVGNALWTLIIFLIVVFVLGKFAWGPVLGLLKEREELIHKSLSDAEKARHELERLNRESAQLIAQARTEADSILSRSRADAERAREEIRAQAKIQADTMVKNAERDIQLETARALQQIRGEAVDLSVMIASKLIGRNLTRADNERLIESALQEVKDNRRH